MDKENKGETSETEEAAYLGQIYSFLILFFCLDAQRWKMIMLVIPRGFYPIIILLVQKANVLKNHILHAAKTSCHSKNIKMINY